MFDKYVHLEKLGNDEVEGIDTGVVYAFPKLDGTNGQLWWDKDSGVIGAGSRNRILSYESDNAGFRNACVEDPRYHRYFSDFPNYTLYGEWLVPHSLTTYQDDAWRKFYVFDVKYQGQFLKYEDYQTTLIKHNLDYLAPIAILKNPSYEQIQGLLESNVFLIKDGQGVGEGVVLKNYDWSNRFGRQTWAKVITNSFKEKHHKAMGVPVINGDLVEEKIAIEFITQHFVDKVVAKIALEDGGWNSKLIGRLLCVVWYDLIREEMWDILKKHNLIKIDFRLLQRLITQRVKELRSDLF